MSSKNVKHFSHPHSLTPLKQEQELVTSNCRGCERPISQPCHGCTKCEYYLHDECLEAPLSISHLSHPSHHLNLLPFPSYSGRSFICSGCGLSGKAFVYHCSLCSFDLHTYCAVSPDTLVLDKHPHELQLVYEPQDRFKFGFTCDLCNAQVDLRRWMYNCADCDYGTHLYCGLSNWWPLVQQNNDATISDKAQIHPREESHKDDQPKADDKKAKDVRNDCSVTPLLPRPQGQKCDCRVEHLSLAMDEVTEIQIQVAKLQNLLSKINMSCATPQV